MENTDENGTEEGDQGERRRDEVHTSYNPGEAPQRSDGYRAPLTFQPALDDPEDLKRFLKGVWESYYSLRQQQCTQSVSRIGIEANSQQSMASLPLVQAHAPNKELGLSASSSFTNNTAHQEAAAAASCSKLTKEEEDRKPPARPSAKERTKTTPAWSTSTSKPPPSAKKPPPRRHPRSCNRASLLRAKSIDFQAPDPEEQGPPNETEDERRRRIERINGRRKRAKKMIEIDFLTEQYHNLEAENDRLRRENASFRERISSLRRLQHARLPQRARIPLPEPSLMPASAIVAPPPPALDTSSTNFFGHALSNQAQDPFTESKETLEGLVATTRHNTPLAQFAIPPSSAALRAIREAATRQEESKEPWAQQQQFVGHERLGLATLPSFAGVSPWGVARQLSTSAVHPQQFLGSVADNSSLTQATLTPASLAPALLQLQLQQQLQLQHMQQQQLLQQQHLQQQAQSLPTGNVSEQAPTAPLLSSSLNQLFYTLLAGNQQSQQGNQEHQYSGQGQEQGHNFPWPPPPPHG